MQDTIAVHDREAVARMERELNLKQLQIKSLLTITQAINDNVNAEGLYNMYRTFLTWDMGVQRVALFVRNDEAWKCTVMHNVGEEVLTDEMKAAFMQYDRMHTVRKDDHPLIRAFDIVIPVYHKKEPIAYALLDGIKESDGAYNKIEFITTYTNIIAVALENKRLFKRQVEQETMRREMELASRVQQMLIPDTLPQGDLFELDAIYKPHYNVGGDYYDIVQYSDHKFAFCVADISGKGIAAALLMANFQANLQSMIYQYRDLQTFVMAINHAVFRITKGDKYITLFVGELDLHAKKLTYINAGNIPPFLKMSDGIRRLDQGCTVIGAFEQIPFIEMGECALHGDGLILAFTDGISELRDSRGREFEDRDIGRVVATYQGWSAKEFNTQLVAEMERFTGDQSFPDDIAALTCVFHV